MSYEALAFKRYLHVLLVTAIIVRCNTHVCKYTPLPKNEISQAPLEQDKSVRVLHKRSFNTPLRIHDWYDSSINSLSRVKKHILKNEIFGDVLQFWSRALKVQDTGGVYYKMRDCTNNQLVIAILGGIRSKRCALGCAAQTKCGDVVVPDSHLDKCHYGLGFHMTSGTRGAGVRNFHLVLYISARNTQKCADGKTLAYASHCQMESVLDRPVAGSINICPLSKMNNREEIKRLKDSISHELLHVLAMSSALFPYFRDANGNPLTPRNPSSGQPSTPRRNNAYVPSELVMRTVTRPNWMVASGIMPKTVRVIVTPNVLREVRHHFNCPTLDGAELEDQGGSSTGGSHWEKRIFQEELMTGSVQIPPTTSRITLALLEDSGWYQVDYSMAKSLNWGRNLGCDFAMKSCYSWMQQRRTSGLDVNPFCAKVGGVQCSWDLKAVTHCNLVKYAQVMPPQYQYFTRIHGITDDVNLYAGQNELADYCPHDTTFLHASSDPQTAALRSSSCIYPKNNLVKRANLMYERYGNKSVCLRHADLWSATQCQTTRSQVHVQSGCYKVVCNPSTGVVIHVGATEYPCYHRGQVIMVKTLSAAFFHSGTLVCPSCQDVCLERGVRCPPDRTPPSQQLPSVRPTAPCGLSIDHPDNVDHPDDVDYDLDYSGQFGGDGDDVNETDVSASRQRCQATVHVVLTFIAVQIFICDKT